MTRHSIGEYAQAIRNRYEKADKEEKTKILDEFTKATGLHRKAAIRLLNRVNKSQSTVRRGRPKKYSREVVVALKTAWEAGDRVCSKRLHPFLPEMVRVLRNNGESNITVEVETQLGKISPSTIDRMLHPKCEKPLSVLRKENSDQVYYYCRAHYCAWIKDPCTYNRFVPGTWDQEYGKRSPLCSAMMRG